MLTQFMLFAIFAFIVFVLHRLHIRSKIKSQDKMHHKLEERTRDLKN